MALGLVSTAFFEAPVDESGTARADEADATDNTQDECHDLLTSEEFLHERVGFGEETCRGVVTASRIFLRAVDLDSHAFQGST